MKSFLSLSSLPVFVLVAVILLHTHYAHGQVKNLGIKTKYIPPPPQDTQEVQSEDLRWLQQNNHQQQEQRELHQFGNTNNNNYNNNYEHNNYNSNLNNIHGTDKIRNNNNYTNNYNYTYNNSHTQHSQYQYEYENFKPAQLYPLSPLPYSNIYDQSSALRRPVVVDAITEFINKTRSSMATGICFKQVPTASLHLNGGKVPVGNGTTADMSEVQVCCVGYERNPHIFNRCDPICKDDCRNGICTAPETCVCFPGHVRSDEEKCISTCPLGCGNGICNEANECVCKEGYKLEADTGKFCIPHCTIPCGGGGRCVAPNKCECKMGFRLFGVGVCELDCGDCTNGHCTSPGVCQCNEGYEIVDGKCRPVCTKACIQGQCIGPNTCACNNGYALDESGFRCLPHCDPPCLNSVCNSPNTCTCYPGYTIDDLQSNVCKPHCPQGCPNGYCTQPNLCVCKPGFIKSGIKGRQQCMAT